MPSRMAKTVAVVALASLAGLLVGCEGSGSRQFARVTAGAGTSWNAVLPGRAVISQGDTTPGTPSWVTSRNDAHLNVRSIEPILATTAWPQTDRPSLYRPLYLRSLRSPESFIYYQSESRYEYRRGR